MMHYPQLPTGEHNPAVPAHQLHRSGGQQQSTPTIGEDPLGGVKNQFITREGVYKVMPLSEYSRPNRVPLNAQTGSASSLANAPVRVSFIRMPENKLLQINQIDDYDHRVPNGVYDTDRGLSNGRESPPLDDCRDRICFNVGRDLYIYSYHGIRSASDLTKPIDKRVYKGTCPTCHDFNTVSATAVSATLAIGFSAGQLQIIDPFRREPPLSKLFNEERSIEKNKVTCLKWVPGDEHHFLAAHSSGFMYLYHDQLSCPPGPLSYQLFKSGDNFAVYTCKTKTSRNPVYRWSIGQGSIHEFAFSHPTEAKFLAVVSQDGYLRIFNYHGMELVGIMRSYFGGLLCCSWSPDAKYVATGGEDDLLTVYSVHEKRVVCRGHGHKSWIAQVSFDAYTSCLDGTTVYSASAGVPIDLGSEEDLPRLPGGTPQQAFSYRTTGSRPHSTVGLPNVPSGGSGMNVPLRRTKLDSVSSVSLSCLCYRIGTVGHDTQLCLWDITEDILKPHHTRLRSSISHLAPQKARRIIMPYHNQNDVSPNRQEKCAPTMQNEAQSPDNPEIQAQQSAKKRGFLLGRKKKDSDTTDGGDTLLKEKKSFHKRGFSLGTRNSQTAQNTGSLSARNNNERTGLLTRNTSTLSTVTQNGDDEVLKLLGTPACPRLNEVPLIEPLICKKIAQERLTVLKFREECIVTACQEGFICTWARPGKAGISNQQSISSPITSGSPHLTGHGSGTVV